MRFKIIGRDSWLEDNGYEVGEVVTAIQPVKEKDEFYVQSKSNLGKGWFSKVDVGICLKKVGKCSTL